MAIARPLTRLAVTGYKPFDEEACVQLAPLTVVFGANGSGKSALVRVPVALAAALRPRPDDGPGLPWECRGIRFGTSMFSLCHGNIADEYTIGATIGEATLNVVVGKEPGSQAHLPGQWVNRWRGAYGDRTSEVGWNRREHRYADDVTGFRGFVPLGQAAAPRDPVLADALAFRVEHLGPRRDSAGGEFVIADPRPVFDVGAGGVDTGRVLAALRAHFPAGLEAVRAALRAVIDVELQVEDLQGGATAGFSLQARRVGQKTWQPLSELGTGFSHMLPVVVQQVAARVVPSPPDLLVVEEPEAHLHPERQASLADVFLDTVRSGACRSLVETHSETFILRLQRRVAEDPSLAPLLRLVFIDDEGGRTVVRSFSVEPDGEVPGWPDGWFDSALHESQALHAARRDAGTR